MSSNYDVFISYQWDIKDQVRYLHDNLTSKGLRVWRDETNMSSTSSLPEQLATNIRNSKVFLCCLTQKYVESKNCVNEINYANAINKNFVILMIDKLKIENLSGVGFIIASKIYIHCYSNPSDWPTSHFDEIYKSIQDNQNSNINYRPSSSSSQKAGNNKLNLWSADGNDKCFKEISSNEWIEQVNGVETFKFKLDDKNQSEKIIILYSQDRNFYIQLTSTQAKWGGEKNKINSVFLNGGWK